MLGIILTGHGGFASGMEKRGLEGIWARIIALVVQPGVEFDHTHIIDYQPQKAVALSKMVEDYDTLVFEAHSTDYQTPQSLRQLVIDHFAILKVGPALTFALREALFSLAAIEEELLPAIEVDFFKACGDIALDQIVCICHCLFRRQILPTVWPEMVSAENQHILRKIKRVG